MTDLLDLLAAEIAPSRTHMVLPDMGTACGRTVLDVTDADSAGARLTFTVGRATCPECAAADPNELRAEMQAMQYRQAKAA